MADVGLPVGAVPAAVGPEDDDGLRLDVAAVEERPQLVLGLALPILIPLQAPLRVQVVLPEDQAVTLVLKPCSDNRVQGHTEGIRPGLGSLGFVTFFPPSCLGSR